MGVSGRIEEINELALQNLSFTLSFELALKISKYRSFLFRREKERKEREKERENLYTPLSNYRFVKFLLHLIIITIISKYSNTKTF